MRCPDCDGPTATGDNPVAFLTGWEVLRWCAQDGCLWERQESATS